LRPVTRRITFETWLRNPSVLGRAATWDDLDYHLTTLFPPVRPRGYVEIRCVDAMPDRWWPSIVALAVTLIDNPVAADAARELCEPVAGEWESASRKGLAHPALKRAVVGYAELAADHCPDTFREDLALLAELYASGRTPSSELRDRMNRDGELSVLEEEAHA